MRTAAKAIPRPFLFRLIYLNAGAGGTGPSLVIIIIFVVLVVGFLAQDCAVLGVNLDVEASYVHVEDQPSLILLKVNLADLSLRGPLGSGYRPLRLDFLYPTSFVDACDAR